MYTIKPAIFDFHIIENNTGYPIRTVPTKVGAKRLINKYIRNKTGFQGYTPRFFIKDLNASTNISAP